MRRITSAYAYDDADRLISVTDAANHVTQYAYDTKNNLASITDANLHTTSFSYDAFGRVTQTSFPSGLAETYVYDAASNLTSKTDRKNQTIQYVYDALNRLTHKGYPDATGVDYVYDLVGKIKQVTDPTGTYGFAYDNMGRLIGTTTQYSFLPGITYTNSYGYDAASNRTSFTAPDGSTNTYAYDTLNRLSTLTNSLTGQFGFSYDALSRRTALNRPNSVNTTYSYDSLSRLLNVLHKAGTTTLDGAGYTYDNAGNRVSKTNYLNNITENYTYDPIYQLTQVVQGATTTESYSYDSVGNRLSSKNMSGYTYNFSDQLTSTVGTSFTYDSNGNTLTKVDANGMTSYTWDYDNRLRSVVLPGSGGTVTFRYDPLGRRVQKGTLGTMAVYLYNGVNIVAELDGNSQFTAHYTQEDEFDQPLAEVSNASPAYYLQDGLNSVTSLIDSSGALSQTYVYESFGNITGSIGVSANKFQFTGRDNDVETGLRYYRMRYYRMRYYDPTLGRFLNEDPLISTSRSLYAYTDNNPINWVDPSGMAMSKAECWRLAQDIKHKSKELVKELAKYDPAKDAAGGFRKRGGGITSPYGHYIEMMQLVGGITRDSLKYWKECRDCDKGPKGPPLPEAIWEPVKRFNQLPKPIFPLVGLPEMEDSYRYKQRFWEDILLGDYLLAVFVTAGETAPAAGTLRGMAPAFAH